MDVALSAPTRIAVPGGNCNSTKTIMFLSTASSGHDPEKQLLLTTTTTTRMVLARRDRAALASRRNEAEARLRDRFLRFGTAVRCLGGAGAGAGGNRLREGEGACSDGAPSSSSPIAAVENVENPAQVPSGTDSRLDALRKRRSHLVESQSSPVAGGSARSAALRTAAASSRDDSTTAAPPTKCSAEDRKQRIEMLRNRRRELEARTTQLLRGERDGGGSAQEHKKGGFATATTSLSSPPSTSSSSSSSSATSRGDKDDESALPKRPRRDLGTATNGDNSAGRKPAAPLSRDRAIDDLERDTTTAGTVAFSTVVATTQNSAEQKEGMKEGRIGGW